MMIELAGVHFAHDRGHDLLAELDLAIAPGEVVAVEAPAGAGATTLVRLLLGELTARGRVAFAGREVSRLRSGSRAALRRRLGIVPQDLGLVGRDSALANVALALEVCGVPRAARLLRARALLEAVDVEPSLPVERLAMAARQRVAWARAVVRSPDAVIADQPTCHQDADGAERFAELIAERAEVGAACLVLTRDPHLIAAGARRGWRMLALHRKTLVDVVPAGADPALAPHADEPVVTPAAVHLHADDRIGPAVPAPLPAVASAPVLALVGSGPTVVVDPAMVLDEEPAELTGERDAPAGPVAGPDIAPAVALFDDEIEIDVDADDAIPNVVPFPVARSAGNRR